MSASITCTNIPVAGQRAVQYGDAKAEIVRLSGASILNNDTGVYDLVDTPILNAASTPVVIGLPHGVTAAISNQRITFTNITGGTLTNLALQVLIMLKK